MYYVSKISCPFYIAAKYEKIGQDFFDVQLVNKDQPLGRAISTRHRHKRTSITIKILYFPRLETQLLII